MQKIIKKFFSAPSIKLNTLVMFEIVLLLTISLGGLLYFTRVTLVEEAKKDAEQRLEGSVQHVDNVLLSIEQTAGNFYYDILEHLDQPDRMGIYCRRLIECNPNVETCAIAFKPNYFPDRELFFTYVHRKKYNSPELVFSEPVTDDRYTKQNWYIETMKTCRPAWIDPGQNHDYKIEPIITFCLPIIEGESDCVGVMLIGLSINLLSQIVLENKPSPNSYCMMLAPNGSYIIHPDRNKLAGRNILKEPEVVNSPSAQAAAKAMLEGKKGDMSFELHGQSWYQFFKPYVRNDLPGRSKYELNWSIATVYPKADIFGSYEQLVLHVLAIVFAALLLFYMLCRMVTRRQLKPLSYLTESAERIAAGHYDETIPNTTRDDEVGVFQQHFQHMQKALYADINKQQEQQETLLKQRQKLQETHRQIQEGDEVKTTFLHNVTDRMITPSTIILNSVTKLCDNYNSIGLEDAELEIVRIRQESDTIIELLSHKFTPTDPAAAPSKETKTGKEGHHE